jgi:hypothetical protein
LSIKISLDLKIGPVTQGIDSLNEKSKLGFCGAIKRGDFWIDSSRFDRRHDQAFST